MATVDVDKLPAGDSESSKTLRAPLLVWLLGKEVKQTTELVANAIQILREQTPWLKATQRSSARLLRDVPLGDCEERGGARERAESELEEVTWRTEWGCLEPVEGAVGKPEDGLMVNCTVGWPGPVT